jgi:hypothetical protein
MLSNKVILEYILLLSLLCALISSGYIFIATNLFKSKQFLGVYSNWQFPMILSIYLEASYLNI